MRRLSSVLPLALMACQPALSAPRPLAPAVVAPPPPLAVASEAAPEPAAPSTLAVPLAEPPVTSWLSELPAVTPDGAIVAVANHVTLGARDDERLLLDLIDVTTDRLVRRVIVSDPDHPESRAGGEAKARKVLAEHTWVKLVAWAVEEDPGAPLREGGMSGPFRSNRATGDGLSAEYGEPVLVVRDATTEAELVRRSPPGWSKAAGSRCPGCDVCPAPLASVSGVWSDRAHRVVLVSVGFRGGTDLCWEPPDELHAVLLSTASPR